MITKTGIYAIRAVVTLAELSPGEYAGAVAIAKKIGAPKNYLGKLLQLLSHEGLVESQKGLGGGFRLARNAETISLYDVVDPIEHIGKRVGCILGRETCSDDNPCVLHSKWKVVRDQYIELLQETFISDLLQKETTLISEQ